MKLVFDIESDGLLDTITKIHCISMIDLDVAIKEPVLYYGDEIQHAIENLQDAELLIGHNICGFDIAAIEKVTGVVLKNKVFDTMLAAELICPEPIQAFYVDPDTNKRIFKTGHSLSAWGMRLGKYKSKIETDWSVYTDEMGKYCAQDTVVTYELYKYLMSKNWPQSSIDFEMEVAPVISKIGQYGIYFDTEKGQRLYAELLEKRMVISEEAQRVFPPWYKFKSMFTYKKDNAEVCKIELTQFNPSSRAHIIDRLTNKYKWKPKKFTEKGNAIMNEEVLESLDYPEARKLSELFMLDKRIGQLATGKEAWISHVKADGRIHGRIRQNGTRTGRCSHQSPNISQVPKDGKPYGAECRTLFRAAPGKVLVGCDFTGLEYAVLAGYMAKYDKGTMAYQVKVADKSKGTDVHTLNAQLFGVDRTTAKTLIYAVMYGSGDIKTGLTIMSGASVEQSKRIGREMKNRIMEALPGLKELLKDINSSFRSRGTKTVSSKGYDVWINGWVRGIDGREVFCAEDYKALNTLIQSAGALITKRGLVELVNLLENKGLTQNKDYGIIIYSHDEVDIECDPKDKEVIKQAALDACRLAGEYFNFPCVMSGEVQEGLTWQDIH